MNRRVIITPWFDTRATGGGARFSIEAAQSWLLQGDEVHILSSDSRRAVTGFEPFLSSGRLQLHQVSRADRMHLAQAFDDVRAFAEWVTHAQELDFLTPRMEETHVCQS